jgi:hypothetical protein
MKSSVHQHDGTAMHWQSTARLLLDHAGLLCENVACLLHLPYEVHLVTAPAGTTVSTMRRRIKGTPDRRLLFDGFRSMIHS